jgi:catechol 2,3-dioxygenase-like lactoylglutathione lyase family enzyme
MSTTQQISRTTVTPASAPELEALKVEALVIPVSDVDRSKEFYEGLGWRLDADFGFDNGFRVVQLTPPGSPASIQFGTGITHQRPGTAEGVYLVVSDIEQAREQLLGLGAEVSEVFHPSAPGAQFGHVSGDRADGRADQAASYGSFATLRDPDGNTFLLQEVTTRLPDRVDETSTDYVSHADLVGALKRAAAAHGEHEARTGEEDPDWPSWYAAYMVAEAHGTPLPE